MHPGARFWRAFLLRTTQGIGQQGLPMYPRSFDAIEESTTVHCADNFGFGCRRGYEESLLLTGAARLYRRSTRTRTRPPVVTWAEPSSRAESPSTKKLGFTIKKLLDYTLSLPRTQERSIDREPRVPEGLC
jgi:hypothetical protein